MKLSKSTLVIPLAGLLVVGAAGAVLATSSDPGAGSSGVVAAAPSASPSASEGTTVKPLRDRDGVLTEVLDGLVADGTIDDSQKTAILDGVTAAREERFAEARERMAEARERAEQLRTFLEDDVITQDEFDQLPEDSRLRELATLMDDGQITRDELRGLFGGRGFGGGHGFGGGFGGGHGFGGRGGIGPWGGSDDATPAPSASPSTSG